MKLTNIDNIIKLVESNEFMNLDEIKNHYLKDSLFDERKIKTAITNCIVKNLIELKDDKINLTQLGCDRIKKLNELIEKENNVKKEVKNKEIKKDIKKPKKKLIKIIPKPKGLKFTKYELSIIESLHSLKNDKWYSLIAIEKWIKNKNKVLVTNTLFRNQIKKSLDNLLDSKFIKINKKSYKLTKRTEDYITLKYITFKKHEFGTKKKINKNILKNDEINVIENNETSIIKNNDNINILENNE